ncbi:hypothetical protein C0J52_11426 [Blattella germanica]|nr:hypothetical protein C0J52_11426 [Blattella germanica]
MADSAMKRINAPDFNPEKYVKELSQRCVGGQELQQQRQKIQVLADETNVLLKKNVYQNYMQFIETAKEISHLESEMYQLSHMLTEQRSLLASLANTSLLGDKIPSALDSDVAAGTQSEDKEEKEEEERRRKLTAILEKVEGCMTLLETPGRTVLHEGDLLELDPIENNPLQRVHAYLFNVDQYDTSLKPCEKLCCIYLFKDNNLSITFINLKALLVIRTVFLRDCVYGSLYDFTQYNNLQYISQPEEMESIIYLFPERVAGQDLDVCIAQRHFEEAYNLLERAREFLEKNTATDPVVTDIKRKVEMRAKNLTEVLMKELEVSPDKSLQGGLRAARRAVRLLNQLGRSTQACDLFLKLCSCILKTQLKRVKREGATVLYVRQVGGIFFSNLTDMAREFLRAFPNSPSCASAFVVWAGSELTHLTSHLIKQVFMPQSSITMLAECVTCVRSQCDQLCELGVDLRYQLDGLLRTPLTRALKDSREKLVDAVKLRAAEDKWRPMNLHSKAGLNKLVQEMSDIGIASIHTYVTGDCWIGLTGNTVAFSKLYLTLLEDCLRLATPELLHTIDEVLGDVFQAQMMHVEASLTSDKYKTEGKFIQKNAAFLLDTLLALAEHCYEEKIGNPCIRLNKLRDEYSWLKKDGTSKQPNSTTSKPVTKYSTTEYI